MNKNSTLRNTIATLTLSLLVAFTNACGDDAPAKSGGFGGLGKASATTKDGKMTVTMTPTQGGAGNTPTATTGNTPTATGGNKPAATGNTPAVGGNTPAATGGNNQGAAALTGSWSLQQGTCALMLVFEGSRVAILEGCELADGTVGVDIEAGNFTVQGSTLTVAVDSLSCAQRTAGTRTATFQLSGNSLTLNTSDGQTLNLTRGEPNIQGTQAVQGCLTPEGFTPAAQ